LGGLGWGKALEEIARPDNPLHFETYITVVFRSAAGSGNGERTIFAPVQIPPLPLKSAAKKVCN